MSDDASVPSRELVSKIDTSVPHSARIWNYWLGGRDNYAVDRVAGDRYRQTFPGIVDVARAARKFLIRSVRYLTREMEVRQFLDIGAGLPTVENTHQIAQREAPESRVVYVDNDPLVLLHAHALLTSSPEGVTEYIEADLHDPERILAATARILDLSHPVGLILIGILGHVADYDEARSIVRRLIAGLPSGSYLSLYTASDSDPAWVEAQLQYNESGAIPYYLRSREQIAGFMEGLEVVEPGVVPIASWRPDAPLTASGPAVVAGIGGVGRKP